MQLGRLDRHSYAAMAAEIRIGTSGWHYKHWLGTFYPADLRASQMFEFYQRTFDTVELNNSFYRLPTTDAFEAWRDSAPANFVFAVKGSRFLTHNKKLKEPEQALDNLLPRAEILGEKLGPILFQLPPKWKLNVERLEDFLRVLPKQHRYTFEFREPTWHTLAVYRILERHNAAYCIHELAGFQTPIVVTADFAYVRLHGPGARYQGSYSEDKLSEWAERINKWKRELKAVYVYFDNDEAGYAPRNALELKWLISKKSGSPKAERGAAVQKKPSAKGTPS
jgi:uncharacterized protein YecE (DUF72 family)